MTPALSRAGTPLTAIVRPRTLVAIPCFNEELAIGSMVLQARSYADTVLVIDDGSKDRTAMIARAAGAEVIVHEKNSGKGTAIQNAFRYARDNGFDALVLMDGDGQHDPAEIPLLLEPVVGRNGHSVDVALGFRHGQNTEMPAWRRVGKRVLDYATAAGGAGVVTDSQCGYRAFGRRAIAEMAGRLEADGFGVESEQLVLMKDAGLAHENVNITCKYDGIDGSTKGPVEHALGVLRSVGRTIVQRKPLWFISLPGAVFFLGGFLLGLHVLQVFGETYQLAYGFAALASLNILLGASMVFMGVMLHAMGDVKRKLESLSARG
jgi:hypothetical protein